MTEDEITLLAIKGMISALPPDTASKCNETIERMRALMSEAGEIAGPLAIAYLGAELQLAGDTD